MTEVAAKMARFFGDPLILLQASDRGHQEKLPLALRESLHRYTETRIWEELHRLKPLGMSSMALVRQGTPGAVIQEECRTRHARLLLIGAPAQSLACDHGMLRELGKLRIPILFVQHPASLLNWIQGRRSLQILALTNSPLPPDLLIRWMGWLRDMGPCIATIACIKEEPTIRLKEMTIKQYPDLIAMTAPLEDLANRKSLAWLRKIPHDAPTNVLCLPAAPTQSDGSGITSPVI